MKSRTRQLLPLLLAAIFAAGCRPPGENDLFLARIYQAQGRVGDAYNSLKRYAEAHPSFRIREELARITGGASPGGKEFLYSAEWEALDREEILKRYLEETRRKIGEYEDFYSQFPLNWMEEAGPAPTSELFPISVVLDRDVLAVALISLDDYLVLLAGVSIMYKDYLHYQNPYLMSGIMLGMRGFYQKAATQFQEAIALDPNNPRAYNNLGITLFKMGDFATARDTLFSALELEPDNIFALNNLGLTYLKLGDRPKAEEYFRRVLTRNPLNLAANFYMGFSYYQEGNLERAERYYREANIINPSLPEINFALGTVMVRLSQWDQAIDYFQKTLALDEGYFKAYVSLGGVYNQKQMFAEAEDALLQAIELEPDYGPAYYNLACAHALQGRRRAAILNLTKALEKGFAEREFILHDPELESIRDDPAFLELIGNL